MENGTKESRYELEEKIKDIYQKTKEVESCCNIIYSAMSNDFEKPDEEDIINNMSVLLEQINTLKNNTFIFLNYLEVTGMFNNSDKDKLNA